MLWSEGSQGKSELLHETERLQSASKNTMFLRVPRSWKRNRLGTWEPEFSLPRIRIISSLIEGKKLKLPSTVGPAVLESWEITWVREELKDKCMTLWLKAMFGEGGPLIKDTGWGHIKSILGDILMALNVWARTRHPEEVNYLGPGTTKAGQSSPTFGGGVLLFEA